MDLDFSNNKDYEREANNKAWEILAEALASGAYSRCGVQVAVGAVVSHWQKHLFLETDPPTQELLDFLTTLQSLTQEAIKATQNALNKEELGGAL